MKKTDRIGNIASLLSRALSLSSGVNDFQISEARVHIRAALERVNKLGKTETHKAKGQQKLHDQWWGNVVSGAAKASTAQTAHIAEGHHVAEAYNKALQNIDSMLQQEYDKLKELENPPEEEQQTYQSSYELLQD